jgi:hypothetical protein
MTAICDVCNAPAGPGGGLIRVYAARSGWEPMDVHPDCLPELDDSPGGAA